MSAATSSITYQPYWWQDAPLVADPPPPLPKTADVVIVGAGYTGLAAALVLLRGGKSVVLLDKQRPGEGASTRNGGITSGHIRPSHSTISKHYGREFADGLWREAAMARADLMEFCRDENIDAKPQNRGWLRGAMTPKHFSAMRREADRLRKFCDIPCQAVPRHELVDEIASPRFYGGLLQQDIGGFHPARFFAGLLQLVKKADGIICHNTLVQAIDTSQTTGKRILTNRGSIMAGEVIVAANGYIGREKRFGQFWRRRFVPVRSSIIVTEELGTKTVKSLMPSLRMYSSSASLTTYFRPTPDGKRILLGSRGTEDSPGPASVAFLKTRLTQILPQLADVGVEYCWAGNVAFSQRMLPSIFQHQGIHYVGGYAGSGTVWARWCGKKLAESMLGYNTPPSVFASQPAPPPVPFYDGVAWFMPAVFAYYGLCDRINDWRYG